jgi:hypothetical protein
MHISFGGTIYQTIISIVFGLIITFILKQGLIGAVIILLIANFFGGYLVRLGIFDWPVMIQTIAIVLIIFIFTRNTSEAIPSPTPLEIL